MKENPIPKKASATQFKNLAYKDHKEAIKDLTQLAT
jgi:hypothetical protein